MEVSKFLFDNIKFIFQLIAIYIIWIFLHYISSHLYIYFCNPFSFIGFVISPFLVPSLHCQALRWTIYNGGNHITTMWMTIGTWVVTKLIK